ncbi:MULTISPECIES: ABC transporter ATP-binding protein [unclassified Haladaptatus]|uniref:ABC transporter ATP-binding protein n=1 Tax=unclassified Haladaptatus TaxID=2622732 RepID=UPI00209C385F|nr:MULTISPECIES: ABC transporter ATP-binding protein [unclassified Haladaptatus]MCO8244880.1 ABC transporter ATP-binding protein [Haladaptatus sp. AB643]MCO8255607.1 ABC transporter ATP-binding protein [Haladaptatus sp. AB618]
MSSIKIEHMTKQYRDTNDDGILAVDDLNIELADGEFLVLVGPSGCGKSTTLRCMAGLESMTSGEIYFGGRDVTDQTPEERNIAMVFQNYALYPKMTAEQNIGFGLKMTTTLSKDERTERVRKTAKMLDIEDLLDDKPKELSGGQQQRVALGRAIVREPEVFLMDEPLSNLDAKLRTTMRTEIQQLQSELGVTTVYVTHDQTEAMTMGDRIAVLNGGRLQQIGTPLECYYEPKNLFVANFIGEPSMNLYPFEVDGNELIGNEIRYPLSDRLREAVGDQQRVTLGIRPEDIEIAERDAPDSFAGTIRVVEPMGDQNFLHLSVSGQEITAAVPGEYEAEEGTSVLLRFPENSVHLFATDGGEALLNCERHSTRLPTVANTEGEAA